MTESPEVKRHDIFLSFHGSEKIFPDDHEEGGWCTMRHIARRLATNVLQRRWWHGLHRTGELSIFFDEHNLKGRSDGRIDHGILEGLLQTRGGGMVAVLATENFFTRPWCLTEMLAAINLATLEDKGARVNLCIVPIDFLDINELKTLRFMREHGNTFIRRHHASDPIKLKDSEGKYRSREKFEDEIADYILDRGESTVLPGDSLEYSFDLMRDAVYCRLSKVPSQKKIKKRLMRDPPPACDEVVDMLQRYLPFDDHKSRLVVNAFVNKWLAPWTSRDWARDRGKLTRHEYRAHEFLCLRQVARSAHDIEDSPGMPELIKSDSSSCSSDGIKGVAGVDFFNSYLDENDDWNKAILRRKVHLNKQLTKLLQHGAVKSGMPEVVVEMIDHDGNQRTVARLECEIEVDQNLTLEQLKQLKKVCKCLAKILKGALNEVGLDPDVLGDIMIGGYWEGSLEIVFETDPNVLSNLYRKLTETDDRLPIGPHGEEETVILSGLSPLFLIKMPALVRYTMKEGENTPDLLLWKEDNARLLCPTSDAARVYLLQGTILFRHDTIEDEPDDVFRSFPTIATLPESQNVLHPLVKAEPVAGSSCECEAVPSMKKIGSPGSADWKHGALSILPYMDDNGQKHGILEWVKDASLLKEQIASMLYKSAGKTEERSVHLYLEDDGSTKILFTVCNVDELKRILDIVFGSNDGAETTFLQQIAEACALNVDQLKLDYSIFASHYERIVLQLETPTREQQKLISECKERKRIRIEGGAGTGKTFVALNLVRDYLDLGSQASDPGSVLYICKNLSLGYHFAKWLCLRCDDITLMNEMLERIVLFTVDGGEPMRLVVNNGQLCPEQSDVSTFGFIVVDESHDIFRLDQDEAGAVFRKEVKRILENNKDANRVLLSDICQASVGRDGIKFPNDNDEPLVLSEVSRSSKHVIAGALAYQFPIKKETSFSHDSDGLQLDSRIFSTPDSKVDFQMYAQKIVEAMVDIRSKFHNIKLHDRVAVAVPDVKFRNGLWKILQELFDSRKEALGQRLVPKRAIDASRALNLWEELPNDRDSWIVVDSISKMCGLERLIVFGVGFDEPIRDDKQRTRTVRSRIYRAITRAHLMFYLINHSVKGGWFEWLDHVEKKETQFSFEAAERSLTQVFRNLLPAESARKQEDIKISSGHGSEATARSSSGQAVEDTVDLLHSRKDHETLVNTGKSDMSADDEAPHGTTPLLPAGNGGVNNLLKSNHKEVKVKKRTFNETSVGQERSLIVNLGIWHTSSDSVSRTNSLSTDGFVPFALSTTAENVLMPEIAAKAVATPAIDAAKRSIIEQNVNQYNEHDVKEIIRTKLEQCKQGMEGLRYEDFRTARDELQFWNASREPITSDLQKNRLRHASESAVRAFITMEDPKDKLSAAFFKIFCDYHLVALGDGSEPPDWIAGKREAQKLLKFYLERLPQIEKAANEELHHRSAFRRPLFKDKAKRREFLNACITFSYTVFDLVPKSENFAHPKLSEEVGKAAAKIVSSKSVELSTVSPKISYVLSEPQLVGTLQGHTSWVSCCTVFANGTRAISGSLDQTLQVWDLSNGTQLFTLQVHGSCVSCCTVFAKDTRAISGSDDNTLKVWDLSNGKGLFTLQGHTYSVNCCVVFSNDTRAISGSRDNTLKVWDLSNGKELFTLQGHMDWVNCCTVFANDTRALSGSLDNTLKVWDLSNGKELFTLQGHTSSVDCCTVFANDTRVLSGSNDTTLKVWDLSNGKELLTLQGHTNRVRCCVVFANGTRAISGSWDETLKVWDLSNGTQLFTLQGHTDGVLCCTVFANDTRVLSGSYNTLKVWALPLA